MGFWIPGNLNLLFTRGYNSQTKFKIRSAKATFYVAGLFCTLYSIYLNISFWQGRFVWKCCVFHLNTPNYNMILQFFNNKKKKNGFQKS